MYSFAKASPTVGEAQKAFRRISPGFGEATPKPDVKLHIEPTKLRQPLGEALAKLRQPDAKPETVVGASPNRGGLGVDRGGRGMMPPADRQTALDGLREVLTEHRQLEWEPWELPMILRSAADARGIRLTRAECESLIGR
jgi:hypothetical protein